MLEDYEETMYFDEISAGHNRRQYLNEESFAAGKNWEKMKVTGIANVKRYGMAL